MDTIYALASGAVPAGVAVIRVSGPAASLVLESISGVLPPPRRASVRVLREPASGAPIDEGLVLWFPAPGSFTGEDIAELHVHGARAVLQALFHVLAELGLRMAEPGEFSRRAFLNDRLDLTRAEGLADLISAETEVQRRQAFSQFQGTLQAQAERWRETLIALRAEVEARIDFSDESDVPAELPPAFQDMLSGLQAEIDAAVGTASSGERVRDGFKVALMGRPNAGKSFLLNVLARRDVAIVTDEAGTTRDVLEVRLDLGGYPVVVFDTAGIREAVSLAEREGVRRARAAAAEADLILWLDAADQGLGGGLDPALEGRNVWRVRTKVDLDAQKSGGRGVSAVSGEGIAELITTLRDAAEASLGRGDALVTRQRQREALAQAAAALRATDGGPEEIVADLLRSATEAIGRLTGRVDVEQVLDRVFADFCIGK